MTLGTESGMFALPPESKEQIEERIGSPFITELPDANCFTLPNGECVSPLPCMHSIPEPLEGEALETAGKVIDLMAALKESLSPGAPEKAADVIEAAAAAAAVADVYEDSSPLAVHRLDSPQDTREWKVERQDGIETFLAPGGQVYVRARPDEGADVIISFTRTRGMTPLRLVLSSQSLTVRRAEKKARREKQELKKRGYDVEE